jgi:Protein of unknown function (DUF2924)
MQFSVMSTAAPQHPEDLAEISAILAAGLLRLLERKSSQILQPGTKTPLDCEARRGGDVTPYKSLSSVAQEITGTKWNGWVFFGLKGSQARK